MLYTFTPNESYAYLLNVEPSNLVFLKTYSTEFDALKPASKKVHKAAEAKGEIIGKKISDKIVKPKPVYDDNLKDSEEIIIPPEKREEILNKLKQVL